MKLIVIYGPPAVGKLTVAKELSKITKYKLFHNHLTFDLVNSIFEVDNPKFWDSHNKLRYDIVKLIVENKMDFITTFGYTKKFPKPLDDIVKLIKKNKGEVYFVQLSCDEKELYKRVKHPNRRNYKKISHIKSLKCGLKEYDYFSPVPYKPNLVIDNTTLSPKKVALKIKKYYKL
jgi:tRNA uridine 5-carbamoylmethylation protein Kti12